MTDIPRRQSIFSFTVQTRRGEEIWGRMCALAQGWPPSSLQVSFLLAPSAEGPHLTLFANRDPHAHERFLAEPRNLAALKWRLGQPGQKERMRGEGWYKWAEVYRGLFMSFKAGDEVAPLQVKEGGWFSYMKMDGKRVSLGRVRHAMSVDTGIPYEDAYLVWVESEVAEIPGGGGDLPWVVLPPGWWKTHRFGAGTGPRTEGRIDPARMERIEYIASLRPREWFRGSSLGLSDYRVAIFPGIAVADTNDPGNALYYYFTHNNSWMPVFELPKREALRSGASRIYHTVAWQQRLRSLIRHASGVVRARVK